MIKYQQILILKKNEVAFAMLLRENQAEIDYLEDWPLHYYEIHDIDQRERILREHIQALEASHADDTMLMADRRRLFILEKRYPAGERISTGRKDHFIAAWMMLLIEGRAGVNFFNQRSVGKHIRQYLSDLCILDDTPDDVLLNEWRAFAKLWLSTCIEDKTYHSTIFGMFAMSDAKLGRKIAREILEVTRVIPAKFKLEKECETFAETMKTVYLTSIEHGDRYWQDVLSELH